jgi:hypothetical protein
MAISPAGLSSRLVVTLLLLGAGASGSSAFHASQANPRATSSSAGRGAISGVVTDGGTGRPIAGALVSLSDPRVQVSAGTVTDSKGRFAFTDLPASQGYTFRAQKSGYYNLGFGQLDVFAGPRIPIPLSANEWRQHIDVLLLPFGTISGTVVDEQGEPVVGVPVNVLTRIAVGGSFQWVVGPMGTTDDRGVYRIDELRRGTYVVHLSNVQSTVPPTTSPAVVAGYTPAMVKQNKGVVPPSFGLDLGGAWLALGQYAVPPPIDGSYRAYPPLYFPGARSFAAAAPVDLADGEHKAGVDFVLQPVSTASVSGRVVGPPDALAGLVVWLLPGDSPAENGNSELGTALVGANGAFTILGVPAGSYTLSAAPSTGDLGLRGATSLGTPGLLPLTSVTVSFSSSGFTSSAPTGGTPYFGRTSVAVGAQDVTDVVLELSAAATIGGRVVNEDGSPLPDLVNVRLSGTGEPTFIAVSTRVVSEAGPASAARSDTAPAATAGGFVFRGLPEGDYLLDASSLAKASLVVKSIIGPDGNYTDRPFHAMADAHISDVIITVTDRPAGLSGVVRDRDGAILTQSAVILFPVERSRWSHFGASPSRIKSAIAVGREGYTLSRLRAGDYLVVATDVSQSSAWQDSRFLAAAAAVATPVTLNWGATTVLNLTWRQVTVR